MDLHEDILEGIEAGLENRKSSPHAANQKEDKLSNTCCFCGAEPMQYSHLKDRLLGTLSKNKHKAIVDGRIRNAFVGQPNAELKTQIYLAYQRNCGGSMMYIVANQDVFCDTYCKMNQLRHFFEVPITGLPSYNLYADMEITKGNNPAAHDIDKCVVDFVTHIRRTFNHISNICLLTKGEDEDTISYHLYSNGLRFSSSHHMKATMQKLVNNFCRDNSSWRSEVDRKTWKDVFMGMVDLKIYEANHCFRLAFSHKWNENIELLPWRFFYGGSQMRNADDITNTAFIRMFRICTWRSSNITDRLMPTIGKINRETNSADHDVEQSPLRQPLKELIFFHTETNGRFLPNEPCPRVTKIAMNSYCVENFMLSVESNEIPRNEDTHCWLINPCSRTHNCRNGHPISDLTAHMTCHKRNFKEVWEHIGHCLRYSRKPACLIAHNGYGFVFRVMRQEFLRWRIGQAIDGIYIADSTHILMDIEYDLHNRMPEKKEESTSTHLTAIPNAWERRCSRTDVAKTYKLNEMHKDIYGVDVQNSHNAEVESLTLMKVCASYGKDFINYLAENMVPLNDIMM